MGWDLCSLDIWKPQHSSFLCLPSPNVAPMQEALIPHTQSCVLGVQGEDMGGCLVSNKALRSLGCSLPEPLGSAYPFHTF